MQLFFHQYLFWHHIVNLCVQINVGVNLCSFIYIVKQFCCNNFGQNVCEHISTKTYTQPIRFRSQSIMAFMIFPIPWRLQSFIIGHNSSCFFGRPRIPPRYILIVTSMCSIHCIVLMHTWLKVSFVLYRYMTSHIIM